MNIFIRDFSFLKFKHKGVSGHQETYVNYFCAEFMDSFDNGDFSIIQLCLIYIDNMKNNI
jgi:hypothetical protein